MKAVRIKVNIGSFVSFREPVGKYRLGKDPVSRYYLELLFQYTLSQ